MARVAYHPKLFGGRPLIEVQLDAYRFPAFTREVRFAKESTGRQWRFDYAWPVHMIALEIEGAVFGRVIVGADGKRHRLGGRHSTGAGLQEDAFKYNRAAILGWMVIRATTTMVRDGFAVTELADAFRSRGIQVDVPPVQPKARTKKGVTHV